MGVLPTSTPSEEEESSDSSCRPVSPSPAPAKPSALEQAAEELAQWVRIAQTIAEVAETKRDAAFLAEALALFAYALDVAKNGLVFASRQLTLQQTALAAASEQLRDRVDALRRCAEECARLADQVGVPSDAACSPPEVLLYQQALHLARRGASCEMMAGAGTHDALLYYRKAHALFDALNRFTSDAEDKARLTNRLLPSIFHLPSPHCTHVSCCWLFFLHCGDVGDG